MKKSVLSASPKTSRYRGDGGPPLNKRKPIPVEIQNSEPKDLGYILSDGKIIGTAVLTNSINGLKTSAIYTDGRIDQDYKGEWTPFEDVNSIINKSPVQAKNQEIQKEENPFAGIERYEQQLRSLGYLQ